MSLTDILIKLIGAALAIVGFCLILAFVNISLFGISFTTFGPIGELVVGVVLLGAGIYIIRGGTVSL